MAVRIAPSMLSADFGRLAEELQAVVEAGADWIHLDVMDGRFVPPITAGGLACAALRRSTALPLDAHLMVVEPERQVPLFLEAGADRVTVHAEACPHLHRVLGQIREGGAKAGVAINPATPLAAIEEVLDAVDLVLIMTVNPGWGGQRLIPSCLDKLEALRSLLDEMEDPPLLQVDGGVKPDNAGLFAAADVLVAGSGVFGAVDRKAAIDALRKAWAEARAPGPAKEEP